MKRQGIGRGKAPHITALFFVASLACAGSDKLGAAGDPPLTSGTATGSGGSPSPGAPVSCEAPQPGSAPLRRLTNYEYRNTLTDLLGDAALVADATRDMVVEPTSLGFRSSAELLTITPLLADNYTSVAIKLAAKLPDLPGLVPCKLDKVDGPCAQEFVETFGKRVFRRPLQRAELVRYSNLYNQSIELDGNFHKALEWVSAALLSSPNFLHRVEVATASNPTTRAIDGYEMASRLSYLLWQTMPDDALFAAAEQGELSTPAGVESWIQRMLSSEKAYRVYEFFEQWLDIDEVPSITRNTEVYGDFSPALKDLWAGETRAFVTDLLANGGTLTDLFSAPYTFANQELARHYGLSGPSTERFEKVNAAERSGVLTQPGLWVHDHQKSTSMVRRGLRLRTDFLCEVVPAPPGDVDVTPPVVDGKLTQKQRLDQHRNNPSCAGCHERMDPAGALFDRFDAVGKLRSKDEGGAPIEAGGEIRLTLDLDGKYASVRELGARMAQSATVQSCVARQAFRFFYGREASGQDQCSLKQLTDTFARNGYRLSDLVFALARTDQFLYRKEEVAQ